MVPNEPSNSHLGARADFWFGLGLTVLGIAVSIESWRMPRLAELNVHPMTAPGLVPGLVGIILSGLGIILFLRASRQKGWRITSGDSEYNSEFWVQTRRFLIALVLCVGYAAGLVGSIPFSVATGLFVFVFIVSFGSRRDFTPAKWIKFTGVAILQAIAVAIVVTYVFETIFLVRLP